MSRQEFDNWVDANSNGGHNQKYYENGISWRVVEMKDGWFALFEYIYDSNQYIPIIQASDLSHAKTHMALSEKVRVPINVMGGMEYA